jgi:hypothetical protein
MAETTIVTPPHAVSSPGFDRFGTIPTADDIKRIYLWGCKLTNAAGVEIPDDVISHHIVEAISFIEHILNTTITPTKFEERQDFRTQDYNSWCFLNVQHCPIISVEEVAVQFINNSNLIVFPSDWLRIYNLSGQIQLTPMSGSLVGWSIGLGGTMILPGGFLSRTEFPQLFSIKYTAGFEQDKIPLLITSLVARWACLQILAQLESLIIAPGIAGYTISLDGAAQAVTKLPAVYGILAQQMVTAFNAELATAKTYYNRVNVQVA